MHKGTELKGILGHVNKSLETVEIINPSEALSKLLDRADHDEYLSRFDTVEAIKFLNENQLFVESIKQALIKSQEPKHYLKWEDLEFDDKEQTMKVSLNGSIHLLCYYRNMFGNLCMIDNTGITIWKENKDFFNDLHLERVE